MPDKSLGTSPAIQLQLCGPTGQPLAEEWLTGNLFGGDVILSSTRYELLPIAVESMLQDFLQPPTEDLGKAGILSVHCDGKMQRLRVDEQLGKRVPVGDSGTEVEIVEYLPNAKPTSAGSFRTAGEAAKNPLLELKVYLPGKDEPTRQVAFARLRCSTWTESTATSCP